MSQEFEYRFEPEVADLSEPAVSIPSEPSYLPPPDTLPHKALRGTIVEQRVEAILLDLPYVRDVQRTEHGGIEDTRDKIDIKVKLDRRRAPGRLSHVNVQVKSSQTGVSIFEGKLASKLRREGDRRKPREWLYDQHLAVVAAGDEFVEGNDIPTMIPRSKVVYDLEKQMYAMRQRDTQFTFRAAD